MSTTTRDGRTGYGNKAYSHKFTDVQHISGWALLLMGVLAVIFLGIALMRKNGFSIAWHSVIAMVLMRAVGDAVEQFMVEVASE
jgi:UPF0716 family protein affecting phage T7 exclusion